MPGLSSLSALAESTLPSDKKQLASSEEIRAGWGGTIRGMLWKRQGYWLRRDKRVAGRNDRGKMVCHQLRLFFGCDGGGWSLLAQCPLTVKRHTQLKGMPSLSPTTLKNVECVLTSLFPSIQIIYKTDLHLEDSGHLSTSS